MTTTINKAFFECSNCGYMEEMPPGTMISSRTTAKVVTEFHDHSRYRDMIHDQTLPSTRNYVCPNKDCRSHKEHDLREAVWFKANRGSYATVYVCKACQTVW